MFANFTKPIWCYELTGEGHPGLRRWWGIHRGPEVKASLHLGQIHLCLAVGLNNPISSRHHDLGLGSCSVYTQTSGSPSALRQFTCSLAIFASLENIDFFFLSVWLQQWSTEGYTNTPHYCIFLPKLIFWETSDSAKWRLKFKVLFWCLHIHQSINGRERRLCFETL